MEWKHINTEQDLQDIINLSHQKPALIIKHSTRCPISSMALSRLERAETPQNIDFYYLDLLKHRNLSSKIAELFVVQHESPQILLIQQGVCTYHESHNGIEMFDIIKNVK